MEDPVRPVLKDEPVRLTTWKGRIYPFRCGSISLKAGDDEERISS
jgi:hypothetical protein